MIVILVFGLVVVFGGAVVVFGAAEAKDRHGPLWSLLAIFLALATVWVTYRLLVPATAHDDDLGIALTSLLLLASPFLSHAAVILVIARAPRISPVLVRSWKVAQVGTAVRGEESTRTIRFSPEGVVLTAAPEDVSTIPYSSVLSARVDGECLVLTWRSGELEREAAFYPVGLGSRDGRIHVARAIRRRLEACRRRIIRGEALPQARASSGRS